MRKRWIAVAALTSCAGGAPVARVTVESPCPAIVDSRLAEPVGFETLGGVFTPVIGPCMLPCEKTEVFSTAADNQAQIALYVFRGNNPRVAQNHSLGNFVIRGLSPRPRGIPQVDV